jgi:hypothetical protein
MRSQTLPSESGYFMANTTVRRCTGTIHVSVAARRGRLARMTPILSASPVVCLTNNPEFRPPPARLGQFPAPGLHGRPAAGLIRAGASRHGLTTDEQDPYQALQDARPWLRPGGCVVVSVPNLAHWTVRLSLLRGRFDYQPPGLMDATHLRWFTRATLRRLFAEAGYTASEFHGVPGLWLAEYRHGVWRCLPWSRRWRVICWATRALPGLFAAQHVIRASLAAPAHPDGAASG